MFPAISRAASIESLSGTVDVEGSAEGGTLFRLRIPGMNA